MVTRYNNFGMRPVAKNNCPERLISLVSETVAKIVNTMTKFQYHCKSSCSTTDLFVVVSNRIVTTFTCLLLLKL